MKGSLCASLAGLLMLAGCQSATETLPTTSPGKSASLRVMEQVAIAAHKCWFASKDQAFRPYRFANELNSLSGSFALRTVSWNSRVMACLRSRGFGTTWAKTIP